MLISHCGRDSKIKAIYVKRKKVRDVSINGTLEEKKKKFP